MNHIFLVNNIIELVVDEKIERILWISGNYTYCYTIDIQTEKFLIQRREVTELESWLYGEILRVSIRDPTFKIALEETITEKSKSLRDNALEIVSYICSGKEPEVYIARYRRRIILEACEKFSISEKTIYKYLRMYWQGGRLPNSLLPSLDRCGGKGKRKTLSDKKIGRKSEGEQGINLTDDDREIFEIAITKWYLNPKKSSLQVAYERMETDYYSENTYVEGKLTGRKAFPEHLKPTPHQFRHWYYLERRDIEEEIILRYGQKHFNQNHRAVASNSTYETFGPGFRYQIDATNFGIYLVNRLNRKYSVGRAIYHIVIDVNSRLIAGIHAGLEGPSYNGAATALYNCTEDKVEFCKRFGIEITESQWPNSCIPKNLLADRGEFVGTLPENAVVNLIMNIENTPSYAPDMKGIVERVIGTIENMLKPLLPGMVHKGYRERGERHHQLYAKLDIYEFTQVLIRAVIKHNNHYIEGYPPTPELIRDEVPPVPVKLWEWGLGNMAGQLTTYPDDFLKQTFMRSGKARVTESGIYFNKKPYHCNTGWEENWYVIARNKRSWTIDICYDNRDSSKIYWIHNDILECCELAKEYQDFGHFQYEEIAQYYSTIKRVVKAKIQDSLTQNDVDFYYNTERIVKRAGRDFKLQNGTDTLSKESTARIRANRKKENESYSKQQAFTLSQGSNSVESNGDESEMKKTTVLEPRANLVDKLAKLNQRKSI